MIMTVVALLVDIQPMFINTNDIKRISIRKGMMTEKEDTNQQEGEEKERDAKVAISSQVLVMMMIGVHSVLEVAMTVITIENNGAQGESIGKRRNNDGGGKFIHVLWLYCQRMDLIPVSAFFSGGNISRAH
jgi:hypothetical protein